MKTINTSFLGAMSLALVTSSSAFADLTCTHLQELRMKSKPLFEVVAYSSELLSTEIQELKNRQLIAAYDRYQATLGLPTAAIGVEQLKSQFKPSFYSYMIGSETFQFVDLKEPTGFYEYIFYSDTNNLTPIEMRGFNPDTNSINVYVNDVLCNLSD